MKIRFVILMIVSLILLFPFSAEAAQSDAYQTFCETKLFVDDLEQEDLPLPDRSIKSLEDFIYALDYLAFYRIGDAVYFDIDPVYAETFYNPYSEFQKAYLRSDLADVYACRLEDSYYSDYGVVAIKYSMSRDVASKPPERIPETKVVSSFAYHPEGDLQLKIPLEESNRMPISCENGEQLYYLAMNGYRPAPVKGSDAQALYEAAKDVLRSCITNDMTRFAIIKAVYDWLTTEVLYDRGTAYSSETYLVQEQAYYLEGVFWNHCAVCDGKAKACALLLNMMMIPCVRETGVSEYGDHAWNLVQLDGTWYLLCTTYGQKDMTEAIERIVPNDSMLLAGQNTPPSQIWGYIPQKRPWISEQASEGGYDIFKAIGDMENINLKVENAGELCALVEEIQARREGEWTLEFQYTGTEKETFPEEMILYLESVSGANVVEIIQNERTVYQVLYLEEE